ncbi:MAG: PilT/PilU family type 4a pilus ATPase [Acidobacteriota bacterium]|nr:PilT/PilU family type 4a pilus ATPase [Acidobacteriota bacterium]
MTEPFRQPHPTKRLAPGARAHLDQLLRLMTDKKASDLHLRPMRPPLLRIHGKLIPVDAEPVPSEVISEMVAAILSPSQKVQLEERMSVDLGYGVAGLARFRGNVFRQRGTLAAVFRRIPFEIQSLEELELPEVLREMTHLRSGLILVTGPTGSGKSTTLAAMMKYVLAYRPIHVITIEDPVEFLFADDLATVSQRQIGTDTTSFPEALRNALRQDPDVILVGEMRDLETVSTVITAAETGHLVFSTLHTNSATQSVDRILDTFPGAQQRQVRIQLAQILKGVISMKLVARQDGSGQVAALEIMRSSPRICDLIEKGQTEPLTEEIESSVSYYRMQSMNQSLLSLMVHGTISCDEAMHQSHDPEDLSLKLRRMFPNLEETEDTMSPSTADFSQITELQQFRKLYEEQEEKQRLLLSAKDERIAELKRTIEDREESLAAQQVQIDELSQQQSQLTGEYNRLRQEAQQKIDKLSERIRELNQRLMVSAK